MKALTHSHSIEQVFAELRTRGETALIAYITAGDPDLLQTKEAVKAMVAGGADIIELGIPFSDPLADGPTIQQAANRALRNGTTLTQVFELVSALNNEGDLQRTIEDGHRVPVPIVLLLYYNTVYTYGRERFCSDAAAAGVSGFIIPDLPPEEGSPLYQGADAAGLDSILLLTPTTTPDRSDLILARSRGFVYYVSVTGVTGVRKEFRSSLLSELRDLKTRASTPVAVGFGISTPDQAKAVSTYADGVIVGSAIVDLLDSTPCAARNGVLSHCISELKASLCPTR